MLPEPITEPLTKPDRWVGLIPGMGRTAIYEAIGRGDLPSIRVGRHVYVPTQQMLQRLGISPTDSDGEAATASPIATADGSGGRLHDLRTSAA